MPQTSLEEWLTLTAREEKILKDLRLLGASAPPFDALRDCLRNTDLSLVIKLCIKDPELDALYKHDSLKGLWDTNLSIINCSPIQSSYEYNPQATIHSLDSLKSTLLYANYKERALSEDQQDQQMAMPFLELSADLGGFLALNKICQIQLKMEHPNVELVLKSATKAAALYLTPGYILLAVCLYHFKSYLEALENLVLAEKLIPHSAIYINNAYLGTPINDIISKSFRSLITGKTMLANLADIPLPHLTQVIYPAMEKQMQTILATLPKEVAEVETMVAELEITAPPQLCV